MPYDGFLLSRNMLH